MLEKEGYKGAINGTTKFKTNVDADGNIIIDSSTPYGTTTVSLTRTNAENSAADNLFVMNTLLGFVDAHANASSNTFDVKWGV